MVYQIIQDSVWHYIFGIGGLVLMLATLVFAATSKKTRTSVWILACGFAVTIGFAAGLVAVDHHRDVQNSTLFSKQLMDEYGVTSSRSLYDIQLDFARFDEARTVFTKDGKETPIFVKQIHSDDRQSEMAFTVIDDKVLYPKANK